MKQTINIFVSSTWIDLIAERDAVETASKRLRAIHFVGMEYFGARPKTPHAISLEEVDRCQVYVGILGHRWGSGITEAEYRRAVGLSLPCLIYLKAGDPDPQLQPHEAAERLAAWRRELQASHIVVHFQDPPELATRLVADLHNLLFDKLVVFGLSQLRGDYGDYDARIQRFLAEYLGTQGAPVPFGGRQDELARLDRWFADPRAPAYAVVGAPAGRGKSALLAHWARGLAAHVDVDVVYFPISIRFRTNLPIVAYASIAARLAGLHDELLLAGPETPVEVWRELMSTYLRRAAPMGRRIIVMLDGIDESAGWQLGPDMFAADPAERVRVLVSARTVAGDLDAGGWVARLGWERPGLALPIDLPPLSPAGVVDVLRQTSFPLERLSRRVDVVAELFRLTSGDPLLVRLYVADLWARGEAVVRLQPEDLGVSQPGLEGFFKRWWEDQRALWANNSPLREPAINAALDVLSCALGPLSTAELLDLLPGQVGLTVWTLDEAMHTVQRFVVGDGEVQGYTFSHPRLADYFYQRLAKAGREGAQDQRFVEWGRVVLADLVNGRRAPSAAPTYLLHFLRRHFDRAACPAADYYGLLTSVWAKAWDRIDRGSSSGFLDDLRAACAAAARENDAAAPGGDAPHLEMELRGALLLSEINSRTLGLSAPLLRTLLTRAIWSPAQAIAAATRIQSAEERLGALLTLVAATDDDDRPLAAAAALAELRTGLATEVGRSALANVLREAAGRSDVHRGPANAGDIFDALARVARQGLQAEQVAMVAAMAEAAVQRSTAPLEQRAILHISFGAFGRLVDEQPTGQALVEDKLGDVSSGHTRHAERLQLIRQRGRLDVDRERWRLPALISAMHVLTAAIATGEAVGIDQLRLLLTAWDVVPPEAGPFDKGVLRLLPNERFDLLISEAAQRPSPDCERLLTGILWNAPSRRRARVAVFLRSPPGLFVKKNWRAEWINSLWLAGAAAVDAANWLERVSATLPAERCVSLCAEIVHARSEPELRAKIATTALSAIERITHQAAGAAVLAAMVDYMQPPGLGDSFESWRCLDLWTPRASWFHELSSPVRRMLVKVHVETETVLVSANRLAAALPWPERGQPGERCRERLQNITRIFYPEPDAATPPGTPHQR